ncbi:hypothetical protein IEQ34_014256 [Dendrobium chrysotoxum]|uniref:Uncharacterized protein n=1 Tax=Dendrobium chrysotoxum TaxID=161865 RepID=A0AAV7GLH0_DENCH|nr:hypothetical protein IEQ34_014256 [Dendrobium chrysotoxum]
MATELAIDSGVWYKLSRQSVSGHSIKVVGKPSSHLRNGSIIFNARIDPLLEFPFDPYWKVFSFIPICSFLPPKVRFLCGFGSLSSLLRSLSFYLNHLVSSESAEMAEWTRACFQSTLKIVNSVSGLVGMSMILYSLWMVRAWFQEMSELSPGFSGSHPPWFIFTFLGLGIFLCVVTCSGHIAAETINGHCLSCVSFSIESKPNILLIFAL